MPSPFDILRIEADADEEEIDRAYRERVIESHPDHGGSAQEFQLVLAAYDQLNSENGDGQTEITWEDIGAAQPQQPNARVEYLNYEVLDDHGWSLQDDRLFEKAAAADLDPTDHGEFLAHPDETLLQAAENRGFTWPYACRGGACANCAVAVSDGSMAQPVNHILPSGMTDRGICLSCVGAPVTEEMQVVFNVKHLPDLNELRLPPRRFELDQLKADD